LRYWRITDRTGTFDEKETYDPQAARERVRAHADHFCQLLAEQPAGPHDRPPLVTSMFDFELFGHWWHEGIDFLETLFRTLAVSPGLRIATASEAIAADESASEEMASEKMASAEPLEEIDLPEGSWGRDGDFSVWWNERTLDYWRRVEGAEEALEAVTAADPSLLPAARRQVLLLQSSDWPFLVEGGSARDYALRRIRGHAGSLRTLVAIARRRGARTEADELFLWGLARRDRIFEPELGGAAIPSARPPLA
jgi:1,4-alpha-glucan branching enzyme